jgi:ATP-binding cassette, subfamily B, bacterial
VSAPPGAQPSGHRRSSQRLGRLWRYARPERHLLLTAGCASVANKVFDLAPPYLIGLGVDVLVSREQSLLARLGPSDPGQQLVLLALLTVVIWSLESLTEYTFQRLFRNAAQGLQHRLRGDTYAAVQRQELAFFEGRGSGELQSILADDVNQLERFLDRGASDILQVLTTVLVVGSTFLWSAPRVGWIACLPVPLILVYAYWFERRLAPRYAAMRSAVGALSDGIAHNLTNIQAIKAFGQEPQEAARLERLSADYAQANRAAIRWSAAFVPTIRMFVLVGFCALLLLAGREVLAGRLHVGLYSSLAILIQRLLWPLTRLGETLDLYQRAMASAERLFGLLDRQPELLPGRRGLPRTQLRGELCFEDVHFTHANGHAVFAGLHLDVPAGQTTAIVGPTGAGKSTLLKLALRFYDPSAGRVLLDGIDLRELEPAALHAGIGLVSQDAHLRSGTIHENIAYGSPGASRAEVERVARLAEAQEFIQRLPQGYETEVGERGQKLSGGQRQRLAIARALLIDPPILVLDEATSSVDTETEALIQRSLAQVCRGRTVLLVAHRLSTVRNAQRIHVLDQGRFVESGSHAELLLRAGLYASLWGVQTGQGPEENTP